LVHSECSFVDFFVMDWKQSVLWCVNTSM
jgi:hypothetical protein